MIKTIAKRGFAALKRCAANPRFQALLVMMLVFGAASALAQSGGSGIQDKYDAGTTALDKVTQQIAAYIPFVVKLCYALAAIFAVVGAISVYIAMNNDEQDVKKKIMMTVGACIFLVAAAQALPAFFNYDSTPTN